MGKIAISLDMNMSFHKLFTFFSQRKSISYTCLKGTNKYIMTLHKLKALMADLLAKRYNELSWQEMYWNRREGGHNLWFSSMISKNEFERCKNMFNDNINYDMDDQFAKVCSLFNTIKEQCLLHYQCTLHIIVDELMMPYFGRHGPNNTFMESQQNLDTNYR